MKRISILLASTLLLGCGGGSGDSNFFAGVWRLIIVTTENTCPFQVDPGDFIATVNQMDNKIVLEKASGTILEGTTDSDSSFIVSRQETVNCVSNSTGAVLPNSFTTFTESIRFSNIDGDDAAVRITREYSNCSGNTVTDSSCRIIGEGSGERID